MEERIFEALKKDMLDGLHVNNACKAGFRLVCEAPNFGMLCRALDKYWGDVVGTYSKPIHGWFEKHYLENKEDFNKYGIFFNDSTGKGKAIVTEGAYEIFGDAKVWVYNKAHVDLSGQARCVARDNSFVCAQDNSSVQLKDYSVCYAYDRSTINANGYSVVDAFDASTIYAGEQAVVIGHSWREITAVGLSEVIAPSERKIKLFKGAKFTQKNLEDL